MPIPEARRRDPHQGGEIQMEFCLSQTDLRLPLVFQKREKMGRSLCRGLLNTITDVAGVKVGQTTTKAIGWSPATQRR
jgi:hypothetical protein